MNNIYTSLALWFILENVYDIYFYYKQATGPSPSVLKLFIFRDIVEHALIRLPRYWLSIFIARFWKFDCIY